MEPRLLIENAALSNCAADPDTENMLIHGDNLLALKALEGKYAGQVKCVYIDPPYFKGLEEETLNALAGSGIIYEDTMVILEADRRTKLEFIDGSAFEITREKDYKSNKHFFLRLKVDKGQEQ